MIKDMIENENYDEVEFEEMLEYRMQKYIDQWTPELSEPSDSEYEF